MQNNLNKDGQPIDTVLVAKAKRLKFKEMYKDYKVDLFNYDSVTTRNTRIRELYKARSELNRSIGHVSAISNMIINKDSHMLINKAITTIRSVIDETLIPINDNRKTTHLCLACKEAVYNKPNRAKPSTHRRTFDHVCSLCEQPSKYYYNVPKTYFHPKVEHTSIIDNVSTEIDTTFFDI